MEIEFDDGFSFGKGAFETVKVYHKEPLFLKEHLERLKNSLEFFGIKRDIDSKEIRDYIKNVEEENFALKIIVSDKNFILTHREDNYIDNYKSFRLKISDTKRNSTSKLVYHKSLCYYENIYEHRLAVKDGFDNALFVNEKDEVAECDFSNIYFVKNKKIYTPPVSSGILKGTMRDFLMENFEIEEKIIKLDETKDLDECFISNSLMGVRNVESIGDIKFKNNDSTLYIQGKIKKLGF